MKVVRQKEVGVFGISWKQYEFLKANYKKYWIPWNLKDELLRDIKWMETSENPDPIGMGFFSFDHPEVRSHPLVIAMEEAFPHPEHEIVEIKSNRYLLLENEMGVERIIPYEPEYFTRGFRQDERKVEGRGKS